MNRGDTRDNSWLQTTGDRANHATRLTER